MISKKCLKINTQHKIFYCTPSSLVIQYIHVQRMQQIQQKLLKLKKVDIKCN